MNPAQVQDVQAFVQAEARLLNQARYPDWLALFAQEGRYWVPLGGDAQSDSDTHNALADEDRLLLTLRVERLLAGRAHSQQPASRSAHVLQLPQVDVCNDHHAEVYTPFTYVESRGEQQIWLAGQWCHRLCREQGAWRIALKRVNLLNAGAAHPAIQLFP
jgi:3-phenylpropionate/cinnamic acid dioxygenase small subunit